VNLGKTAIHRKIETSKNQSIDYSTIRHTTTRADWIQPALDAYLCPNAHYFLRNFTPKPTQTAKMSLGDDIFGQKFWNIQKKCIYLQPQIDEL